MKHFKRKQFDLIHPKKKKNGFHLHNYLLFSVPVYIISKKMGILGVKRFVLGEIHDIIIL
jgi:hypothetical protein